MFQNHTPVDKSKGVVKVGRGRQGDTCSKTMHLSTKAGGARAKYAREVGEVGEVGAFRDCLTKNERCLTTQQLKHHHA